METQMLELTPYDNFLYALKAKESRRQYPNRLDKFLCYLGLEGTIKEKCTQLYKIGKDVNLLETHIKRFINSQKERIEKNEISEGTLCNYIKALKLFCSMNDIVINWRKIGKGVPAERHNAEDRVPTFDEIRKLLEHPDRRLKPIVLTMLSSGIRVGSWDYLQWKHVIPIKRNGVIVAAKLIAKNTKIKNRTYYSFLTPEAYNSLKDWMDFRQLHGEKITGESWLMRDTWLKIDRKHSHNIGLAKYPKKMDGIAIRNMLFEAWMVQGVRKKLDREKKRHEFKSSHSFRKIFETKCQKAKMNHNNIKLLMDHSLGESQNYHRPDQDDLLEDYLNVVDLLTLSEENRLQRKIETLEIDKNKMDLFAIEIAEMKKRIGMS
jgi:Phage integrase family